MTPTNEQQLTTAEETHLGTAVDETAQNDAVELPEGAETSAAGTEEGQDPFAVFGGEEVKVEPRRKDAHQGVILSVTHRIADNDKQSEAFVVSLQSNNTGNTAEYTVWVPKIYAENTGKFIRREMGIEDLSPGVPDTSNPGKMVKGTNERAHYGMAIKNSAGDASLQLLLSVAAKSGRRPTPAASQIESFTDLVTELNEVLSGVDVIFTRAPEVTDDNPRGFLRVNGIYFPGDIIDPATGVTKPKALKNYVKHWETQA